jgi:hypothetical protein
MVRQHRARRGWMGVLSLLLLSLLPDQARAGGRPTPEAAARIQSEWDKVREDYERELRVLEKRIQALEAQARTLAANPQARAEQITRDRADALEAYLQRSGREEALARAAADEDRSATTEIEISASRTYVDSIVDEWRDGAERAELQEARTTLQQNLERLNASLTALTEAVEARSDLVVQSGLLDKTAEIEAAVKEARDWLTARYERERAAHEREREHRARDAAERARGRP